MICQLVVLISGNGSNLQAIIDSIKARQCPAVIKAVISNNAAAFGLQRAQAAGIATYVIEHQHYPDRAAFDRALLNLIAGFQPDLVVLAGFMRILTTEFVVHFAGRLINIHPSLLPKYPGLHTHQRALQAADKQHGCSVHFVTPELDGGPVIIQAATSIEPNTTLELLTKEVAELEHKIYPLAIQWFAEQRLTLVNNKSLLDGKPLPINGYRYVKTN